MIYFQLAYKKCNRNKLQNYHRVVWLPKWLGLLIKFERIFAPLPQRGDNLPRKVLATLSTTSKSPESSTWPPCTRLTLNEKQNKVKSFINSTRETVLSVKATSPAIYCKALVLLWQRLAMQLCASTKAWRSSWLL